MKMGGLTSDSSVVDQDARQTLIGWDRRVTGREPSSRLSVSIASCSIAPSPLSSRWHSVALPSARPRVLDRPWRPPCVRAPRRADSFLPSPGEAARHQPGRSAHDTRDSRSSRRVVRSLRPAIRRPCTFEPRAVPGALIQAVTWRPPILQTAGTENGFDRGATALSRGVYATDVLGHGWFLPRPTLTLAARQTSVTPAPGVRSNWLARRRTGPRR